MLRKTHRIKQVLESLATETRQLDEVATQREADVDPYVVGVMVSDQEAEDAIAATAFSASLTMEAIPKELRTGMRVKFSHGHGKIARIFTSPFLLDKKHHHASKEEPIFLVKHDKGGKHSLHKAGALTPIK